MFLAYRIRAMPFFQPEIQSARGKKTFILCVVRYSFSKVLNILCANQFTKLAQAKKKKTTTKTSTRTPKTQATQRINPKVIEV